MPSSPSRLVCPPDGVARVGIVVPRAARRTAAARQGRSRCRSNPRRDDRNLSGRRWDVRSGRPASRWTGRADGSPVAARHCRPPVPRSLGYTGCRQFRRWPRRAPVRAAATWSAGPRPGPDRRPFLLMSKRCRLARHLAELVDASEAGLRLFVLKDLGDGRVIVRCRHGGSPGTEGNRAALLRSQSKDHLIPGRYSSDASR